MNKYWNKLKAEFEANPLQTIAVCALAATAASKLLDSLTAAQSRRAYARGVDYRVNNR